MERECDVAGMSDRRSAPEEVFEGVGDEHLRNGPQLQSLSGERSLGRIHRRRHLVGFLRGAWQHRGALPSHSQPLVHVETFTCLGT